MSRIISVTFVVLLVLILDSTSGYTKRKGYEGTYYSGNNILNRFLGFRIGEEKKCVCMNWRSCEGTINPYPSVPCTPSYSFVCCIQPDPEPNPGMDNYNTDCQDNQFYDDFVLEIPGLEEIPNPNLCP